MWPKWRKYFAYHFLGFTHKKATVTQGGQFFIRSLLNNTPWDYNLPWAKWLAIWWCISPIPFTLKHCMSWCHNCQRINRYCILHQGQHPRRRKRKWPHSLPCWPHTIGTYTHVPPFVLPRPTTTQELVILHTPNYGAKKSTTWTNFHYTLWKVCVSVFLIVYNHPSFYT